MAFSQGTILEDLVWDFFHVSLLPEKPGPVQFKFLRPVAILVASAKLWSRTLTTPFVTLHC